MRILLLVALTATVGCYSFSSTSLPGHIQTMQIPVVENATLEAILSEEVTTALTERFVQINNPRVVQRDADAVLEGQIVGYETRVFGFNTEQTADEYIVVITVNLTFRDRVKNKEIWKEQGLRGTGSYFVGATGGGPSTEIEARILAIKQVVDFAVSRTVEGW